VIVRSLLLILSLLLATNAFAWTELTCNAKGEQSNISWAKNRSDLNLLSKNRGVKSAQKKFYIRFKTSLLGNESIQYKTPTRWLEVKKSIKSYESIDEQRISVGGSAEGTSSTGNFKVYEKLSLFFTIDRDDGKLNVTWIDHKWSTTDKTDSIRWNQSLFAKGKGSCTASKKKF